MDRRYFNLFSRYILEKCHHDMVDDISNTVFYAIVEKYGSEFLIDILTESRFYMENPPSFSKTNAGYQKLMEKTRHSVQEDVRKDMRSIVRNEKIDNILKNNNKK